MLLKSEKDELRQNGFVLLKEYAANATILHLAEQLGLHFLPEGRPSVDVLTPKREVRSNQKSYSDMFGYNAFPMHTDLAHWSVPPRYIILRCVNGYKEVMTSVLDAKRVIDDIGSSVASRCLVTPRKNVNGKKSIYRTLEVGQSCDAIIRWDTSFLMAASPAGTRGMLLFQEALGRCNATPVELCDRDDTLIIDNWRTLHSRSIVPSSCINRVIERVYLEVLH